MKEDMTDKNLFNPNNHVIEYNYNYSIFKFLLKITFFLYSHLT